ncbi:unnamed protein product [Schistosoma margrebowiei]|uniref:Uncharacterized protein n=1 Tax=Schistosoma margrebowiei TaxID=48269 RepID=A0A183MTF6_9TREM|nr:unnamed protein product [Schistosoma margrebowiei]
MGIRQIKRGEAAGPENIPAEFFVSPEHNNKPRLMDTFKRRLKIDNQHIYRELIMMMLIGFVFSSDLASIHLSINYQLIIVETEDIIRQLPFKG